MGLSPSAATESSPTRDSLFRKIQSLRKIQNLIPPGQPFVIPLEMWENRIEPALYELEKEKGIEKLRAVIENQTVQFVSNNQNFIQSLNPANPVSSPSDQPGLTLYFFSGITELSILRRLKDYPDETSRLELEAPWVAECPEARSVIIVNLAL